MVDFNPKSGIIIQDPVKFTVIYELDKTYLFSESLSSDRFYSEFQPDGKLVQAVRCVHDEDYGSGPIIDSFLFKIDENEIRIGKDVTDFVISPEKVPKNIEGLVKVVDNIYFTIRYLNNDLRNGFFRAYNLKLEIPRIEEPDNKLLLRQLPKNFKDVIENISNYDYMRDVFRVNFDK